MIHIRRKCQGLGGPWIHDLEKALVLTSVQSAQKPWALSTFLPLPQTHSQYFLLWNQVICPQSVSFRALHVKAREPLISKGTVGWVKVGLWGWLS